VRHRHDANHHRENPAHLDTRSPRHPGENPPKESPSLFPSAIHSVGLGFEERPLHASHLTLGVIVPTKSREEKFPRPVFF
jgi:hypothetical protein